MSLRSCTIGLSGAIALANNPNLASLLYLDLNGNNFGDDGAVAIARSPYLSNLTYLNLGRCNIGDAGIAALEQSNNLRNLKSLILEYNNFGNESERLLVQSKKFTHLETLNIKRRNSEGQIFESLTNHYWTWRMFKNVRTGMHKALMQLELHLHCTDEDANNKIVECLGQYPQDSMLISALFMISSPHFRGFWFDYPVHSNKKRIIREGIIKHLQTLEQSAWSGQSFINWLEKAHDNRNKDEILSRFAQRFSERFGKIRLKNSNELVDFIRKDKSLMLLSILMRLEGNYDFPENFPTDDQIAKYLTADQLNSMLDQQESSVKKEQDELEEVLFAPD